jgi:hypothetical protein
VVLEVSKPNVFISYSDADADRAWLRKFASELEELGVVTWYARPGLQPDDPYVEELADGLRASELFVVLLSPSTATRPSVFFELGAAIAADRPVFAVSPTGSDANLDLPFRIRKARRLGPSSPEAAAKQVAAATHAA